MKRPRRRERREEKAVRTRINARRHGGGDGLHALLRRLIEMAWNEDITGRLDDRGGDRPFARIALKSSDLRKLRARTSRTHRVTLSQNLRRLEKMGAAGLSRRRLDF